MTNLVDEDAIFASERKTNSLVNMYAVSIPTMYARIAETSKLRK